MMKVFMTRQEEGTTDLIVSTNNSSLSTTEETFNLHMSEEQTRLNKETSKEEDTKKEKLFTIAEEMLILIMDPEEEQDRIEAENDPQVSNRECIVIRTKAIQFQKRVENDKMLRNC